MHSQWQLPVETKSRRKINDISSDPPHPFRCIRCSLLIIVSDSIRFASAFYRVFLDVSSTHRRNIHLFYFFESNLPPRQQSFSTLGFSEASNASPKSLWRKIFSHLFYYIEIYMHLASLSLVTNVCACAGQRDVVHTNQLEIVIIHRDDAWGSEAAATSSSKEMINMTSSHNVTAFPISKHHT